MAKVEYANKWCKYVFTEEEVKVFASEMDKIIQQQGVVESEKKAVMSTYTERLNTLKKDLELAANRHRDKSEMRSTECWIERDYVLGEIRYVRTDTGEVAETSKMTMAERQMSIDEAIPANRTTEVEGEGEVDDDPELTAIVTGEKSDAEIRSDNTLRGIMTSEKASF